MLRLNSRRTPKPSGKKKKAVNIDELEEEKAEDEAIEEPIYQREKDKGTVPDLATNFSSSNLYGIAYDAENKQMWVRFKDGSIYQYYNVPLAVYRDFWHAKSKGSYFWDKVRRNYKIPYRRLTSSLRFIPVSSMRLCTSKIIKSKAKLQLKAAKETVTLYNKINANVQELLDTLHSMECEGFTSLRNVEIEYEEDYVYIHTDIKDIWIQYDKHLYKVSVDTPQEPGIYFECDEDEFIPKASNEIFAYIESSK